MASRVSEWQEVFWAELQEIAARRAANQTDHSPDKFARAADAVERYASAREEVTRREETLGWRGQSALRVARLSNGVSFAEYLSQRVGRAEDRQAIEALAWAENDLRDAEAEATRLASPSGDLRLVGLALSGGGIRSATFNLGVLQALSKHGVLGQVDYLSSVSGGGYIGGTVSTLLSNPKEDPASPTFPLRHDRGKHESVAIKHLRRGASYLAPDGALDTIRIPALVLRGLLVNLLLLLPYVLMAVMATNVLYGRQIREALGTPRIPTAEFYQLTMFLAAVLAAWAVGFPPVRRVFPFDWTWRNRAERWYAYIFALTIVVALINTLPVMLLRYDRTDLKPLIAGGGVGTLLTLLAPLVPLLMASGTPRALGTWRGRFMVYALGLVGPLVLLLIYLELASVWILSPQLSLADMSCYQAAPATPCPAWQATLYRLVINTLSVTNLRLPWTGTTLPLNDWALLVFAGVLFIWGWYAIDVNLTALHGFYRDRLSHAYLFRVQRDSTGAETAVVHADGLPLSSLGPKGGHAPYHLINATLNLQGSREAAGRRADFFLFSKRYVGSRLTGYCKTSTLEQADPRVDLGTSIAISGAALAPNTGTMTNRALVFVMTLLNVRTGYWLPNPLKVKHGFGPFRGVGPAFLLLELFGLLHERRRYVNVSDGGHVENLGLYELLRRRCRYIIVCDAEADDRLTFEGLAKAMQYARTDAGIEIELDLDLLRKDTAGLSRSHWALGKIRYGDGDDGTLLYLKASLTGRESEDVKSYRSQNEQTGKFPHESTTQQFFKDGQFEAYRALGYRIAEDVLGHWVRGRVADFDKWFKSLGDHHAYRQRASPAPRHRRAKPVVSGDAGTREGGRS